MMTLQDGSQPDLRSRGIVFQAVGFAAVGGLSTAMLFIFAGSEYWAFQVLELCATKLYWAFLAPLAAVFDWVRKMFETRGELRRRVFEMEAELLFRSKMEQAGLSQDLIERIIAGERGGQASNGGDHSSNGGIDPQIKRYIDQRFEELDKD